MKTTKKFLLDPLSKDVLQKKLISIINNYKNIAFAYIHGSFLTEEHFPGIDIAIFLSEELSTSKDQILRREINLEVGLQDELDYPFDVRIINHVPLSFCYNVNGKLLCSRSEELRVDFVTKTIDNYINFLPYSKRYLKEVLGLEI